MPKASLFLLLLLSSTLAWGHAFLINPTPRNDNDNIKRGPCGDVPRSANPVEYVAGTNVTLNWRESVNHPGRFYINFLRNDQPIRELAEIPDNDSTQREFSFVLTVPDEPCDDCSLQLVQSMEENRNNPSFYYSCADIIILPAGSVAPEPPAVDDSPSSADLDQSPSPENLTDKQNPPELPKMGTCWFSSSISSANDDSFKPPSRFLMPIPILKIYGLEWLMIQNFQSLSHFKLNHA